MRDTTQPHALSRLGCRSVRTCRTRRASTSSPVIAYAAVIQTWLQHPEADQVEFVLDLIVSALPEWMTVRPGA
jgi:hypothetical protein